MISCLLVLCTLLGIDDHIGFDARGALVPYQMSLADYPIHYHALDSSVQAVSLEKGVYISECNGCLGFNIIDQRSSMIADLSVGSPTVQALRPQGLSVSYSGPIVISKGGVYTGRWESMNPEVPVVLIETTDPVTIQDCFVRGRGHLIQASRDSVDVTIRNCFGVGLNPEKAGARVGKFAGFWKPKSVRIERNTLVSTGGISVNGGGSAVQIVFRQNRVRNIDGRVSDGRENYLAKRSLTQFVQLNGVRDSSEVEIAWNEVVNEPWNSAVEDNISIYLSSGTPSSPIVIHDNYIQGAYGINPSSSDYSGGGIIIDGAGISSSQSSRYVGIYNNQVVGTSNHGISIAAGNNITVRDNIVVSSGKLPDGSRIESANVGLYVWNYYKVPGSMFENLVTGNTVGWVNAKGQVNNWWFPDCSKPNCDGNVAVSGEITLEAERAEWRRWNDKIAAVGLQIGAKLVGQERHLERSSTRRSRESDQPAPLR